MTNNLFRALPLALVLALAACDSSGTADPVGASAAEADIALGATASLGGLAVSFDAVAEDSRCPDEPGVDCLWAGRALVDLRVAGQDAQLRVVEDPAAEPGAGLEVGDLRLYAVALVPEPSASGPSDDTPVVTIVTLDARR